MKSYTKRKCLKLGGIFLLVPLTLYCYYHMDISNIQSLWYQEAKPTPWQVYVNQRMQRGDNYSFINMTTDVLDYSVSTNVTEKVKHFLLTKVEKTASSTLAAILARFVLQHKQNVMTMTFGGHLDVTKRKGQVPGWNIGPRTNEKAEVLIDHARYNQTFIDNHFVPDVQLITSVRDAESWFHSAVNFWPKQVGRRSAERALRDNKTYVSRSVLNDEYNGMKTIYHLSQMQWLGFDYSYRNNITAIQKYIDYIVPKYNVVILADEFDASLILLRRRFRWDHSDILYISKEVRKYKGYPKLSEKSRKLLLSLEVNLGDQMLYEAFKYSWKQQPEIQLQDFWDEVEYFKSLNADAVQRCKQIKRTSSPYTYNATKWSAKTTLNQDLCLMLGYPKGYLLQRVARYALGSKFRRS